MKYGSNNPRPLPSIEELLEVVRLDPSSPTGLAWVTGRRNGTKAGDPAGGLKKNGYYGLRIKRIDYRAQRIIYLLHYGVDPGKYLVDHIDGDVTNNAPENYRLATIAENNRNVKSHCDSTSRFTGVSWHSTAGKWQAVVRKDGKNHYAGTYNMETLAARAYNRLAAELFGEFFRHNGVTDADFDAEMQLMHDAMARLSL